MKKKLTVLSNACINSEQTSYYLTSPHNKRASGFWQIRINLFCQTVVNIDNVMGNLIYLKKGVFLWKKFIF